MPFAPICSSRPPFIPHCVSVCLSVCVCFQGSRAVSGPQLQRAASAVVAFCDACRPTLLQRAASAELRRTGGLLPADDGFDAVRVPPLISSSCRMVSGDACLQGAEAGDPEADIRQAVLLDSVSVAWRGGGGVGDVCMDGGC